MTYYVYEIKVGGIRRYIGITDNPIRRNKEHWRGIKNRDTNKMLYRKIQLSDQIDFNIIYKYETKTEAVRMEAFIILSDLYGDRNLWQSAPRVVKYF